MVVRELIEILTKLDQKKEICLFSTDQEPGDMQVLDYDYHYCIKGESK